MPKPRSSRTSALPVLLAIATPALALLNWQIATRPLDVTPLSPAAAALPAEAITPEADKTVLIAADAAALDRMAEFTETLARPLFRADRRPYVAKPVAEMAATAVAEQAPAIADVPSSDSIAQKPNAPPLPAGLTLVGIMSDAAGERRALLRFAGATANRWLAAGAELDGWTITTMTPTAISLSASGATATLELYTATAGGSATSHVDAEPGEQQK
ncbi:MAG: hypothetical protein ABL907_19045 [Hyphomicrobium sp.]